jgi:hypothetical protein
VVDLPRPLIPPTAAWIIGELILATRVLAPVVIHESEGADLSQEPQLSRLGGVLFSEMARSEGMDAEIAAAANAGLILPANQH